MNVTDTQLEKINDELLADGYQLSPPTLTDLDKRVRLIDAEGDFVAMLPDFLLEQFIAEVTSQVRRVEICHWLRETLNAARQSSYTLGKKDGRAEIVDTVHELIGVDALVNAAKNIARSVDACAPI